MSGLYRVIPVLLLLALAAAPARAAEPGGELASAPAAAAAADGSAAAPGGFTIAPYLVDVGEDAATVGFELAQAASATLLLHDGDTTRTLTSPAPSRLHLLRIDGLAPGRSYRYEVQAAGAGPRTPPDDPTYRLSTAARPGEAFSFVVYGDPRPGETGTQLHHRNIVGRALAVEPAFVLLLGDLVDDGRVPAQWVDFFRIEAPLLRRAAAYPVLGDNDHAGGDGIAARYFPVLEQGWYELVWGGVRFFGMLAWDTRGEQPAATYDESSPQLTWLAARLADPEVQAAPFRVVFLHDPVHTVRGRAARPFRRIWAPVLARGRVDVVFASWHLYERAQQDGVVHIISGGAGAELVWMAPEPGLMPALAEARRHHFCRVDVRPGAMEIWAIAEDGTVLDTTTLTPRGPALPAAAASPAAASTAPAALHGQRDPLPAAGASAAPAAAGRPAAGAALLAGLGDAARPICWSLLVPLAMLLAASAGPPRRRFALAAMLAGALPVGSALLAMARPELTGIPTVALPLGLAVNGALLVLLLLRPLSGRPRPRVESESSVPHADSSAPHAGLAADLLCVVLGLLLAPLQVLAGGRLLPQIAAGLADPLQRVAAFALLLLYQAGFYAPLAAVLVAVKLAWRPAAAAGSGAQPAALAEQPGASRRSRSRLLLELLLAAALVASSGALLLQGAAGRS